MTKYFKAEIWLFDEEEYHTHESLKDEVEDGMNHRAHEGLCVCWEKVKVNEVELDEYEKED